MKLQRIQHNGYETCGACGGLIVELCHEWQGEDDRGIGHTIVTEECEDCHVTGSYTIGEDCTVVVHA